jgi:TRAP-type C4-dicarboxylate transport system substrate-binding protein
MLNIFPKYREDAMNKTMGIMAAGIALLAVHASAADEVKLSYATLSNPQAKTQRLFFQPWVDKVNAAGKGVVVIAPIDGLTIANFGNVYTRVMTDVVQIAWSLQSTLAGQFGISEAAGLPFVAEDSERASVALYRLYKSGGAGREYDEIVPLLLVVFPQSGVHLAKAPARPLTELKGLKLNALGRMQAAAIEALGGAPLTLPGTDMYEAITRGTMDGAVASWTTFAPFKLGEVTRYHMDAKLGTSTGMLFMAKKRYEGLPAASRTVIDAHSGESLSRAFGAYIDWDVGETKKEALGSGKDSVEAMKPEVAAAWERKVADVVDGWIKANPARGPALQTYRRLLGEVKAGG